MSVAAIPSVARGCGTRTEGAVYLECGTGYGGRPLEYFLSDPPHYQRDFASIQYEVFPLAPDAPVPETTPALIASLPITNVSVIKAGTARITKRLQRSGSS